MMLRRMGMVWETTLNNECIHFHGILDDEESLETDQTGKILVIRRVVLTIETVTAKRFAFKQIIQDEEETDWYVMETLKDSDGSLTRCVLVEVE